MPGVQLLDVSGPLDVFAEASVQRWVAANGRYHTRLLGGNDVRLA
jgi:hypothetical protein